LRVRGGYEGTLDPFASGLLLVGVGRATRFFPFFAHLLKEYVATLKLGEETDTLDVEGKVVERADVPVLSEEEVRSVLRMFVGTYEQIPPRYSALKVKGRRAYDLARRGEDFNVRPRKVHVESLELISLEGDTITFRCSVGRGTYVRALGRDIARALGTVGHLTMLRRTAIGDFRVEDAKHPDEVETSDLISPERALYWMDALEISGREGRLFLNGGRVRTRTGDGLYRVFVDGEFVGVGRVVEGLLKPERLLPRR